MCTKIASHISELRDKYSEVLRLDREGKPVFPLVKEMWLIAENIESETHKSFIKAQNVSKLLRNYVNAGEAGGITQPTESLDNLIEQALQNPYTQNYLPVLGPDAFYFQEFEAAVDALSKQLTN
jgi:hypothetical protein